MTQAAAVGTTTVAAAPAVFPTVLAVRAGWLGGVVAVGSAHLLDTPNRTVTM